VRRFGQRAGEASRVGTWMAIAGLESGHQTFTPGAWPVEGHWQPHGAKSIDDGGDATGKKMRVRHGLTRR